MGMKKMLMIAALLTAASGCARMQWDRPARGSRIAFSAATTYDNRLPRSKTAYSGDLYQVDGRTYERIDWQRGDRIRIYCNQAEGVPTADYLVNDYTGDTDRYSRAEIVSADGNGLRWGEEDEHRFIAMYPSPATTAFSEEEQALVRLDGTSMQGLIPAVQSLHTGADGHLQPAMQYAWLYAATTVDSGHSSGSVNLCFKPMYTAFEFTMGCSTEDMLLERFEMRSSSCALTGTFTAEVTGGSGDDAVARFDCPDFEAEVNGSVSVDFTQDGAPTRIAAGESLTFTVLALPQDLRDLVIRLKTGKGVESLALSRDGESITFPACRKIRIMGLDVPAGGWSYTLEETDPVDLTFAGGISRTGQITSLRSDGQTREAIPWEVEGYFQDAECTLPYDGMEAGKRPDWISGFEADGTGTTQTTVIAYSASPVASTQMEDAGTAIDEELAAAEPVGSPEHPANLSNPSDPDSDRIVESANSYIVNAPGYYRIPLVLGNGIMDGAPNPDREAWQGSEGSGIRRFQDYTGNDIISPLLHRSSAEAGTPAGAFVVWEDVAGLIETGDNDSLDTNAILSTGAGDDRVWWLTFRVAEAHQGNAVIAVTDTGGRVMWSWHIWMTHYVPKGSPRYQGSGNKDLPVSSFSGDRQFTMMPFNLGAVIIGDAEVSVHEPRTVYVKIRQEESGKTAIMKVSDPGFRFLETIPDRGRSPYFQWGRKDAMWPNDGYGNTEMTWMGRSPSLQAAAEPVSLGEAIRSPGIFYAVGEDRHWLSGADREHPAYNLWNAGRDRSDWDDEPVRKTIYDPSPAGYVLPPAAAYSGFTATGEAVSDMSLVNADMEKGLRRGAYFYTDPTRTTTIFFPTLGERDVSTGRLYGMGDVAYAHYWTADLSYLPTAGWGLYFYYSEYYQTGYVSVGYPYHAAYGYPVRPVWE